jgi:hypothetical protein
VTGKLHIRRFLKPLIAFCAVVAMLTVSAASLSAAHVHARTPANQCDICFTVHVVSSEAVAVVHLFQRPETHERFVPGDVIQGYRLLTVRSAVDRGPPSL